VVGYIPAIPTDHFWF